MKISNHILNILGQCRVEGSVLYLPDVQLPRQDYVAVNKVLEMLGGKWNRKFKGHVFDYDPENALETVIITSEVTDQKKEFQFFETPTELAERLCDMAELTTDSAVLEPSCGKGSIADAVWKRNPKRLLGIELNTGMNRYLTEKKYETQIGQDFLAFETDEFFDRIVMNPPFSKHQDAIHVQKAFDLLTPGGILVAIVSICFRFRTDRVYTQFRNFLEENCAEVTELPEGIFKNSGTMVLTCIIKIRKGAE